jgi:hydrogenase maturation factor
MSMLLIPLLAFGINRHVSLDGTQDYTSIQAAINDAQSGDVVLVHPGRYIENIDLSNKQNITLASMEYTTGDTTYVSTTIIDGAANANSTVLFYENAVNIILRGFSITGGRGYDYYSGASAYQVFGGGIFFYSNCSANLLNLNVYGNKASMGGGVTILQTNTVSMSNVNIYNNVARYAAGGLHIGSSPQGGSPAITFSQTDRCSIYNNFAQWGMDIHWHYIHYGTVSIYLKKFTVPSYERYYADHYDAGYDTSPYVVFDIQEAYLQPIDADIYVSPLGSDSNDGLSPTIALKTPSLGTQRIASNPDQPRTVHLLAGIHHNVLMDEYIPIAMKDYTILQGVSESQTRLYAENLIQGTGVVTMGIRRFGMTMKNVSITTSMASALFSWEIFDGHYENITVENSSVGQWMIAMGYINSIITMKNITMRNNIAQYNNFGMNIRGSVIKLDNIEIRDSGVPSMPGPWERACGTFDIAVRDTLIVRNSKFINNTHYSEDGFANFRTFYGPQSSQVVIFDNCIFANNSSYGGTRDIDIFGGQSVDFINCTFANNTGTYLDYLRIGSYENRIINCIFSNNSNYYDIRTTPDTHIENSLFSKTNNIYRVYEDQSLNWGVNNIIGTDPLFSGSDPALPSSYYLYSDDVNGYSPAIDAGTMDSAILPLGYAIPQYDAFGFNRVYGSGIDRLF